MYMCTVFRDRQTECGTIIAHIISIALHVRNTCTCVHVLYVYKHASIRTCIQYIHVHIVLVCTYMTVNMYIHVHVQIIHVPVL